MPSNPSHSRPGPRSLRHVARIALLLALLLMVSVPGRAAGAQEAALPEALPVADPTLPYAPGVVLVGLAHGVDGPALQAIPEEGDTAFPPISSFGTLEPLLPRSSRPALFAQADQVSPQARLGRIHRLHLPPGADVLATVQTLAVHRDVEFAEPDYLAQRLLVPNDPLYAQQWALPKVGAPAAWDVTTGDAAVAIAIIDSGLDLTHQEFAGRLWTNPGEVAGNGIDDDGNGKIDDVHGWDFVAASGDLADDNGHGTQVAGVIGAKANNGAGIAGVCWSCPLLPITVMREAGVVNYSDIALGVAYAIERGARVINLSLGGYSDSTTLRTAIESAATTAVLVAGTGNDGRTDPLYPAAYPEVLAVAATDSADARASFSNHGDWVGLAAPGVAIQTTFAGANGYGAESGTSLSSAYVAGTAGLVVSAHPDWSPAQVRAQLLYTAHPLGTEGLGSGRLRAGAALTTAPQPRMTVTGWSVDGAVGARPAPGQTFDLVLTLENAWRPARDVTATLLESDAYVTVPDAQGAFGSLETGRSATNAANPFRVTLAASTPYNHPIPFTVRLAGADGYALDVPFILTVRSGVETIPGGSVFETDTTWTSDKTYVLAGNASVAAGATLTIAPGTQISAAPGVWLRIDGTLIADGTEEEPITFTTTSETGEKWAGLRFSDSAVAAAFDAEGNYTGGSLLRHVYISDAETGVGCASRAPYFSDSTFAENNVGVSTSHDAAMRIDACAFTDNDTGAQLVGSGRVTRSAFTQNRLGLGAGFLAVDGGDIVVSRNRFHDNDDQGASLFGTAAVTFTENLVAGNGAAPTGADPVGVWIGSACESGVHLVVANNTIISNANVGLALDHCPTASVTIAANNLVGNALYDFRTFTRDVELGANYWGDIASYQIASRIYDCNDTEEGCGGSATVGQVTRSGDLTDPDQTAPAFVRSVSVSPDTVGLERATVEVTFSRPMLPAEVPAVGIHDARRGTEERFTQAVLVETAAVDSTGAIWAAPQTTPRLWRYDGTTWTAFNADNSGIFDNTVYAIQSTRSDGCLWFGSQGYGVARLCGSQWTAFTSEPGSGLVHEISEDSEGRIWFALNTGAASYDGNTWRTYTTADGLPSSETRDVAADSLGRVWLLTAGGVGYLTGDRWVPVPEICGLSTAWSESLHADRQGRLWVSLYGSGEWRLAAYEGGEWRCYRDQEVGASVSMVRAYSEAPDGTLAMAAGGGLTTLLDGVWTAVASSFNSLLWLGYDSHANLWVVDDFRIGVHWGGLDYRIVDNAEWLAPNRYRATVEVTTEIPHGTYVVSVADAVGTDGIMIAPHEVQTFTIDYAGAVTDGTAPSRPTVTALGDGSLSTIRAEWSSADAESGIDQYRYAVGTTPGGRDVRDWVYVSGNTTSATITGLLLQRGQTYYVSMAARNGAGLWSPSGISNPVVAGEVTVIPSTVLLPLLRR